jgi:hypothetical protein
MLHWSGSSHLVETDNTQQEGSQQGAAANEANRSFAQLLSEQSVDDKP